MRIRTALLILLLSGIALAADQPGTRIARARDVIGLWQLVTLSNAD